MKKQIGFSEELSSNGSIKYVYVEDNFNKKSINAVEFLENPYLSYVKKVEINSTTKFVEDNFNKKSINAVEFLENPYLSYVKKVEINSTTKFVEYVDITALPNKSYIYYVEDNFNKKSINAVEFLENLYLSYIKKVEINSTTKFVEYVDITALPNKSYIYYVDIISRIEAYARDRILREPISVSDQIFIRTEIIRLFPEIIELIENYQNHLRKPFFDKHYFSDSFSLSHGKVINDSFIEIESVYFNFSKQLFDNILNVEEIAKGVEKPLSENFITEEKKRLHLIKVKNNSIELTETNILNFNKELLDSYIMTSEGNIFRHNYSNTGTYFTENYVGQVFQIQ